MDDNYVPMLQDSQHEWAARVVRHFQPLIYEGIQGMFHEAKKICRVSEEDEKYLMTFQNILARIPKWNEDIIKTETARIVERSGCSYLEDLITCVHIAQLKILTSIRTGKSQKKVEIDIPKLSSFVHKCYISASRDLYTNVYLFETGVSSLVMQQNRTKIYDYIKLSIINVIRDSIPIEQLLRAYLDETTDLIKEEVKEEKPKKELSFSDKDTAVTVDNVTSVIDAPKDLQTLEKLAELKNVEAAEDKLTISNELVTIDVEDLNKPEVPIHLDIEELKIEVENPNIEVEILS
jgi:hypothetical protein